MPLGMEVGLSPGDFVLDWDPAPLSSKRGRSPLPTFPPIHCGQTAGWIKMALGMKVGSSSLFSSKVEVLSTTVKI